MQDWSLRVGRAHLARLKKPGGIEAVLVGVALRRCKSDSDLAVVLLSWEGSPRIETQEVHCMHRNQSDHRMLAVLPVSSKLRAVIRSHGDP